MRVSGGRALRTPAVQDAAESGWGDQTTVIEIYVALQTPAAAPGTAVVTIEAAVQGELKSCSEFADLCNGGSTG